MKMRKERLDKLLVDRGLVETRSKSQVLIMAGEVKVSGETVWKPATKVAIDSEVELLAPLPYVSRGGYKLAAALEKFEIDVSGRTCVDVGACTGGFTDVLLKNGAAKVYAIDVGYGQLDWGLRQDHRVIPMERTNARYIESLPDPITFVCIDVSFISLKLIFPAVLGWLSNEADVVALVKPQFEAGRELVGKGGVVRDIETHRKVLIDVLTSADSLGLFTAGLVRSPIKGSTGNTEFLAWLKPIEFWRPSGNHPALHFSETIESALRIDPDPDRESRSQ